MTYPFIAAAARYGTRKGPVMAFVVHMAEGGGTVGFLSRPNPRGVSVHYVIEYTGRIVQMVREIDATGSINPSDLRTTDDPTVFGVTVRKQVMGAWDHDPNSAVISVEIEGFAKTGPNSAQHGSLKSLIADVRSRHPRMGLLGHRDFQDYKPCPGRLIHWDDFGGHGPAANQETPVRSFTFDATAKVGTLTVKGTGHYYLRLRDDTQHGPIDPVAFGSHAAFGPVKLIGGGITGPADTRVDGYVVGQEAAFLIVADVTFTATANSDCKDAVAAEHERVRQAALTAVGAI